MHAPLLLIIAGLLLIIMAAQAAPASNEVYVRPDAPPGGTGQTPQDPVASLQQALDRFEGPMGYVFLAPGVYKEDVVISQGKFWLRPMERTGGVMIEGSLTIRTPGIVVRGMDFRSSGSAITLDEGASDCQILQCRMLALGAGGVGIDVSGGSLSNVFLSDNVVDLRGGEGSGRTGLRLKAGDGMAGVHLDHNQVAGCETGIAITAGEGVPNAPIHVTGNRLLENATGLLIAGPGVSARRNDFRGNATVGLHVQAAPAALDANRMTGDRVGLLCAADGVSAANNVVSQPAAQAVLVQSGSATLVHHTLHRDADSGAPLIAVAPGASATVRNSILSGPGRLVTAEGALSLSHNLYAHQPESPDQGAVVGQPLFVDPANGDLRLGAGSPAAHQVEPGELGQDAAGIGRPWGPKASLGAYEVEGPRAGRTYVVAPGAAGGDGSAGKPFGSIPEALARALPGDTVLLRPGTYAPGVIEITRSGAPQALITIRSEQPHAAKLAGVEFRFSDCSYVRLEGCDFTDMGRNAPIRFGPYATHCEVVNNVFARSEEGGTAVAVSGPGATHHLIEGNRVALTKGGVGIQINCQRHNWHQIIRNNDISGCYYGIQTGGGSYPTAPPGYNLIENNVIHDNTVDGIHTKSTDDTIRGNHFYNNPGHGITTREGARNVIVGNWIHDNGTGIRLHSPSHFVINNVIYDNRGHGITALQHPRTTHYEAAYEVWIAHNTIWGNGREPIHIGLHSQGMILRNILAGQDPQQYGIVCTSGGVIRQADSNLYHHVRPPLLREYEGGRFDRVGDPLPRNPEQGDFRPRPGSPALRPPQLDDALSVVLSARPAGVPLPDHLGSNLGPPQ